MKRGVDLAEELGITYRQVWHWESKGYVNSTSADLEKPDGLDFGPMEERVLRIMAGLVKFGVKPEPASQLARDHVNSGSRTTHVDVDGVGRLTISG